jgi:hypothetical protein
MNEDLLLEVVVEILERSDGECENKKTKNPEADPSPTASLTT